ncbi:nodulation protein NolU [Bradyrhizobium sacchari]|uniref:Nodulation protein NolU n=1 Tax=Bradyrhizobium sacchari TaxID=1399419 RepID=A0A560JJD9_9BRAD|nr:nodulation protein NolU [Bradyrhizobium sacchari]OPY95989.1 nodulation protein NolU [Bradyrhizobium sacchari]TWB51280.1 nodulation protein NolU [Bradyrhizobium sacchari]TWB69514.1 nodulation protein NolU [Bradyrhizobium sacchari]
MSASMSSTKSNRSFTLVPDRLRELAASVDPGRFAGLLDPLLSPSTLARLQQSARLQPRLAELLLGSNVEVSCADWNEDALLGHDPRRAALLAGSTWHARSILKLVSRHDLPKLVELIGPEPHAFAVRNLSSAVATTPIVDPEQLSRQIEYDGHACLGAWLEETSSLARICVLLRLPVGTAAESPTAEHRSAAGQLLSLVMAHLRTEAAGA